MKLKNIKLSKIAILLFISCFLCSSLYSQNKNADYQNLFAKAQILFDKQPELFNKDDLAKLNEIINLEVNQFGEENVRLCQNLVERAKKKKIEYDQYLIQLKNMSATLDTLDGEIARRQEAEDRNIELLSENTNLKQIIENLNVVIANYKKQEQKLVNANKRLEKENLFAKDLLQESSGLVAQMLTLMNNINIGNISTDSLPQTLIDSLEDAQCRVAQLLKSNFLITIQQLRINKEFMDSASIYYTTNHIHILEVNEYIENGEELVKKLKNNGLDCAIKYANDIEMEMFDFIDSIENSQNNPNSFMQFIQNNLYWLIPILLVLIIGIIILIRNTSKKTDK